MLSCRVTLRNTSRAMRLGIHLDWCMRGTLSKACVMVAAEHCTVMVKCMRATGSLAGAVAKARAKICMQTYCIVAAAAVAAGSTP